MATLTVSNIHFESTGNTRITETGGLLTVHENENKVISVSNVNIILGNTDGYSTNTVYISRDHYTPNTGYYSIYLASATSNAAGYIPSNAVYSTSTYSALASQILYTGNTTNFNIVTSVDTISANGYEDVIYAGGKFVIVGRGVIRYSTDGVAWSNATSANANIMYGIGHGNGIYVAAGGGGAIQTSTDGITWTNRTTANTNQMRAAAYGNGVYVAGGASGALQSSTNGTTWTNRTTVNGSFEVTSMTYGNGYFTAGAVLNPGLGARYVAVWKSTDGSAWIEALNFSVGGTNANNVFVGYGNGVYVAGESVSTITYYSTDTITWTDTNRTVGSSRVDPHTRIYYSNNVFITTSSTNRLVTSTNGVEWVAGESFAEGYVGSATLDSSGSTLTTAYDGNVFIIISDNRSFGNATTCYIYRTLSPTEFYVPPHPLTSTSTTPPVYGQVKTS